MPLYGKRPKITWSASFANTLTIAWPLDDWRSYSQPREGSVFTQAVSGLEDAWVHGTDYYLSGVVRWIPTTDSTSPVATGWDGSTGWRAFLEWARQKNAFRFYPDATSGTYIDSYLVEPMSGDHGVEANGNRSIRIVIRNSTNSYDGY